MVDHGMYYNGSGCKDKTAYKAIMGAAKPGDVWKEGERLVLILKNQGAFSNVLMLHDERKHSRMMGIISGKLFYADPAMVRYVFNERLGVYVQRLPRDEFARVRGEVADALDFAAEKEKSERDVCHALLDRILDRSGVK